MIKRFSFRTELYEKVLEQPESLEEPEYFLRPLFNRDPDKIYNIVTIQYLAARLRDGMQYLKADHIRGNDMETMIVSRIEVDEQQELMF